jgi:Uma2 family endonuclease
MFITRVKGECSAGKPNDFMVIQDRLYTVDEFETYEQAYPNKLLELIDGRIVEKVTSERYGKIAVIIASELCLYLKTHTEIHGQYSVESSLRPAGDDKNERRPDVTFRLTDEAASEASYLTTFPDFVAEIKSPNNSYEELRSKARFYIANGTRLVWLVYPNKRVAEVYDAEGNSEIYTQDSDILSGEPVLPDFQMTLAEIFRLGRTLRYALHIL